MAPQDIAHIGVVCVFIYLLYGRPVGGRCAPEVVRHTKSKPLFQKTIPALQRIQRNPAQHSIPFGTERLPPAVNVRTRIDPRRGRSMSLREIFVSRRADRCHENIFIYTTDLHGRKDVSVEQNLRRQAYCVRGDSGYIYTVYLYYTSNTNNRSSFQGFYTYLGR